MGKRAKATLAKKSCYWDIETKCPRCKSKIEERVETETEYLFEIKELMCPKCGLVFKERVSST